MISWMDYSLVYLESVGPGQQTHSHFQTAGLGTNGSLSFSSHTVWDNFNGDARNLIRSYRIFEGQAGPTDLL